MASTRALKTRIRSVTSTKQITKAMQLVAASKMRRAQDSTKLSTPYANAAGELLQNLAKQVVTDKHPLFVRRKLERRLIIVIASDKGLAGAYNSNVLKKYLELLRSDDERGVENLTIAVGRKAAQFVTRLKDTKVIGSYEDLADRPASVDSHAILSTITDMYVNAEVDVVTIVYTDFVNSVVQTAKWQRLLPAGTKTKIDPTDMADSLEEAKYEPSAREVLDFVAKRLIGAQLFQAMLDARASEHSMRMLAMKNATDNASDLVEDLQLAMNKARQGAITQELAEISGSVEAMNE